MKGKYDVPFFQNNEQNADLIKRVKAKAQELVSTEGESKEEATDSGLMGSRLVEAEEVVTFVVPTARVPILGDLVQDGEMCLLDVGIFGEVGVLPPYRVAAVALELHGEVNIAAIFCANKDSRLNDNTYGIQVRPQKRDTYIYE